MEAEIIIQYIKVVLSKGIMFSVGFVAGALCILFLGLLYVIIPKFKTFIRTLEFLHKHQDALKEESKFLCPKCGEPLVKKPYIIRGLVTPEKRLIEVMDNFYKLSCSSGACSWHNDYLVQDLNIYRC